MNTPLLAHISKQLGASLKTVILRNSGLSLNLEYLFIRDLFKQCSQIKSLCLHSFNLSAIFTGIGSHTPILVGLSRLECLDIGNCSGVEDFSPALQNLRILKMGAGFYGNGVLASLYQACPQLVEIYLTEIASEQILDVAGLTKLK